MAGKSGFGQLSKMRSGRWQARYTGPDHRLHTGPCTYTRKADGTAWLASERRLIEADMWTPPKQRRADAEAAAAARALNTFERYAASWLTERDLKPRTKVFYRGLLNRLILPTFGADILTEITPAKVRTWYADMGTGTPTQRAHAYSLLRTILKTAETDGEIPRNPCHIRGAGTTKRATQTQVLDRAELAALVAAMPPERRALVILTTFCALRFGEAAALRRRDVDLDAGVIHVRRAVVRLPGKVETGTTKSAAGVRDVHMPPVVVDALRRHLDAYPVIADGLVFPGKNGKELASSSLYGRPDGQGFIAARNAIGRPDLRWHDLRHTGAVLAAQAGATLKELMARLGHSTPAAALRYQHAASERDALIAARIGEAWEVGKAEA